LKINTRMLWVTAASSLLAFLIGFYVSQNYWIEYWIALNSPSKAYQDARLLNLLQKGDIKMAKFVVANNIGRELHFYKWRLERFNYQYHLLKHSEGYLYREQEFMDYVRNAYLSERNMPNRDIAESDIAFVLNAIESNSKTSR
jgi:hypothetical protein